MLHEIMSWQLSWPWFAQAFLYGYLAGAIPFGILVSRVFGLGDLRKQGSGNIGATNVLRTGNKLAAFLTLLLDFAKGAIPVLILYRWGDVTAQLAGLGAFLGHCFPIWLKFRGGKGVATFLGVMLGLSWMGWALCCLSWLVAAALTRISSVGALAASALAPVWLWMLGRQDAVLLAIVLAVLIWLFHAANLGRLARGEEPKIGQKR